MDLSKTIKTQRRLVGISQFQLAVKSQVSVPTIQNIEAGRANPSIETLESILESLELKLEILPSEYDLDRLAAIGVPIDSMKPKRKTRLVERDLKIEIVKAAVFLSSTGPRDERLTDAFQAYCLALKMHFPTLFSSSASSRAFRSFFPRKISGKHVKLRRIAIRNILEVLK